MNDLLVRAAERFGLIKAPWMRRMVLTALARFGQSDFTIEHHWVPGKKLRLHRFRHKGYWFYGRNRERVTMESFAALIEPRATVIELGAHIGYVSLYLARLAGRDGHVYVFEPSPDNLAYTRANLAGETGITLIEKAASEKSGVATFFEERLTGQNSSLVEDYWAFAGNKARSFSNESYRPIEVETTTLDEFVKSQRIDPDFIKIDVEGAELSCLKGSVETLNRCRPRLMVEITREKEGVTALLTGLGYELYDEKLTKVHPNVGHSDVNSFFIHRDDPLPVAQRN